jgi:hypothetical protein
MSETVALNDPNIFNALTDLNFAAYLESYFLEIDASSNPYGIQSSLDVSRLFILNFKVSL